MNIFLQTEKSIHNYSKKRILQRNLEVENSFHHQRDGVSVLFNVFFFIVMIKMK